VKRQIKNVIESIGSEVQEIFVVDDCCPDGTANYVRTEVNDPRVTIIQHEVNLGVGGAVITGYRAALASGSEVIVKIDGDGQMDPSLISKFIEPIVKHSADYSKGTRFFFLDTLEKMPKLRLFGNAVLSFVNKVSSGYWNIMDPTNGYTAIHRSCLEMLPLDKIANRYFFESDMLFRLGTLRAVVVDIPMKAKYEDEESSLSVSKVAFEFPLLYIKCFFKRVFYNYFLRDFNGASLELLLGTILILSGGIWGGISWWRAGIEQIASSNGTVMLAVLPIILGFQLLLSAIHFDMSSTPTKSIQSINK
jgi:dolichol-phosphate mannosyltransferase